MGGLAKKLLATAVEQSLEPIAGAVDFGGTNDYLSRSSDLVGNADGKTFTFSAWFYLSKKGFSVSSNFIEIGRLRIQHSGSGTFLILGYADGASSQSLYAIFAGDYRLAAESYINIQISIDLADSNKRHVYVNDAQVPVYWNTYLNDVLDLTFAPNTVASRRNFSEKMDGRLAHVFLDYTYRDLSIESNRRLFITADRKPAEGMEALNPILYLPLTDPTQPGKNLGTGGDFALTGVVARSGRGPNQYNTPYSDLDGAADYLSRTTAPVGIADGKRVTFQFCWSPKTFASTQEVLCFRHTLNGPRVLVDSYYAANYARFEFRNSSNTAIAVYTTSTSFVVGRNYIFTVSFDLSSASLRHVYINGLSDAGTWSTYTNQDIQLNITSNAQYLVGCKYGSGSFVNGRLGDVFFHTSYIDLSVQANREKFVTGTGIDAKPVDLGANGEKPFGTPPPIYLPMYGNNAGKNYGTGGDFTVNSGPFPGARGPNEFWGNKADFNGATGYLARNGGLSGASDGKTFSLSFFISPDVLTGSQFVLFPFDSGGNRGGVIVTSTVIRIIFNNGTSTLLDVSFTHGMSAGLLYHFCCAVDLSSTAKRPAFINGVQVSGQTWAAYVNAIIPFSSGLFSSWAIGSANGAAFLDGKLSEFYFTTDYIDFSQEANRLKFRDAFGNPVALLPQIEAGEIPNPAIYMRFDPANFGKNYGTGGDFTVNGTITDGGQL